MAVCTRPAVSTCTSAVEYLSAWRTVALAAVTPSCCIRCTTRCRDEAILLAAAEPESGCVRLAPVTVMGGSWATLPVSTAVVPATGALQASTRSDITPHCIGLMEKITHTLQQGGFGVGEIAAAVV